MSTGDGPPGLPRLHSFEQIAASPSSLVYRAWQVLDGQVKRHVAVKLLQTVTPGRDLRELSLTVDLGQHPNIITVYDVLRTDTGVPCLVMEYCPGGSLGGRRMSVAQVIEAALAVTDALAYAHERGVLHRDLKPENILVRDSTPPLTNSYVLADFGTARLVDARMSRSTQECTYLYASPQVFAGRPATVADDIWSLGATLFTLLDGSPPFTADDDPDGATDPVSYGFRVTSEPPRTLRRRDVPPALAQLIRRCLEKDANSRFASASELRAALAALPPNASRVVFSPHPAASRAHEPTADPEEDILPAVSALALAGHQPSVDTGVPATVIDNEAPPPRRRTRLWYGLIGAAAALVIAAVAVVPRIVGGDTAQIGAGGLVTASGTGPGSGAPTPTAMDTPGPTPTLNSATPTSAESRPTPTSASSPATAAAPTASPTAPDPATVFRLAWGVFSPQLRDGTCVYRVIYGDYTRSFTQVSFYSGDCGSTVVKVAAARGSTITYEADRGQEPISGDGSQDPCGASVGIQATAGATPSTAVGVRITFGATDNVVFFGPDGGKALVPVGSC